MPGPETLEHQPLPEIQIGGGDFIRIKSFEKIIVHREAGGLAINKLPTETLKLITEDLENLPFSLGNKDSIGTSVKKNKHKVALQLYPRVVPDDAPEDEKGKYILLFQFEGNAFRDGGLHMNTHNNLTITQNREKNGPISSIVLFSTDQPLHVAGTEIRQIGLIVQVLPPQSISYPVHF